MERNIEIENSLVAASLASLPHHHFLPSRLGRPPAAWISTSNRPKDDHHVATRQFAPYLQVLCPEAGTGIPIFSRLTAGVLQGPSDLCVPRTPALVLVCCTAARRDRSHPIQEPVGMPVCAERRVYGGPMSYQLVTTPNFVFPVSQLALATQCASSCSLIARLTGDETDGREWAEQRGGHPYMYGTECLMSSAIRRLQGTWVFALLVTGASSSMDPRPDWIGQPNQMDIGQ
ncbi:hypothetical protein B0H67DRAFT_161885 [Lasiosphaeris hirsuta]|uniref:Uncharacterized protein n=1 Tax=Lasiosphaeris hirsuta TaxID=260670 RepID=A0AA40APP5_9PEZI|nr:hypothetical protein B0H67DRAFT_161885 [Lasiosphaeris hirsuta]